MTRAVVDIHNAWCAFVASEGFGDLCRAVSERLSRALGTQVEIEVAVVDTVDRAQIEKLVAAGQTAFAIEGGADGRAAAVASRLLPAKILRLLTGSDKLSVSQSFCRAGMELLVLNAASALSEATGKRLLVSPVPSGASMNSPTFVQLRAVLRIGGPAGDLAVFVPACMPPAGGRFAFFKRALAIPASAGLDLEPMDVSLVGSLMPDDVVNLAAAGGGTAASLRIDLGSGAVREFGLDAAGLLSGGTVKITGGGAEVNMAEIISGRHETDSRGPGAAPSGKFKLPVRLEVLAFELGAPDLDALSPGQVLEVRADAGRGARMYVCGELFAEGRLERFEDFDGFRIEKIF